MIRKPLHVGRPNIGDPQTALRNIDEVFKSGWLTNNGQFVKQLEAEVASRLGVKHVIAVCNATIGLQLVLRALIDELDGEVIVPSFTFVATAQAPQWLGLQPVFADSSEDDHGLDPRDVERKITPRTRAILGVHLWGGPSHVTPLQALADKYALPLIFDAAHAFDGEYQGIKIGNFGRAEVFSFHATKVFNTAEGGAITTNDSALYDKLCLMRNFGFAGTDKISTLGTNAKMSEISACIGLANLPHVDEFVANNHFKHSYYADKLQSIPGITLFRPLKDGRSNHHYAVVEVNPDITGVGRDVLVEKLWAQNILARRYFYPGLNRVPPFGQPDAPFDPDLPVSERLVQQVMVLPTGPSVNVEDIDQITGIIASTIAGARCQSP